MLPYVMLGLLLSGETGSSTECAFRRMTYNVALKTTPERAPLLDVFDSLELATMCGDARPSPPTTKPAGDWPTVFPPPLASDPRAFYVDPTPKGSDTAAGTLANPFATVGRALQAARSSAGDVQAAGSSAGNATISLRAGVHYVMETVALDSRDNGLTLQNYNGEAAWLSGGIPLTTSWTRWNNGSHPKPKTCEAGCVEAGHCCVGLASSWQHPSCAMGCALGKQSTTVDVCVAGCQAADNKCVWTVGNLTGNNCESCPAGCEHPNGVVACTLGCELAFGVDTSPNIWVTDVPDNAVVDITGLMSIEPHSRYMRARWPNPTSGTQELRPVANTEPLSYMAPSKKPKADQVYVNATAQSGYDSSILTDYNAYASGNCKTAYDPNCPCGAWSDVRDGEWSSWSYWCSEHAAGGWAEMDTGNGYYNGPILPTGMSYDPVRQERFDHYKNATGAIVVPWRAQGWFVNMYEVEAHNKETHQFTWSKGGFQGGRGWQLNGTSGAVDPTPPFYIENVFEEIDIASEWYFDQSERKLYLYQNGTAGTAPVASTQYVATHLKRVVTIIGTKAAPVHGVTVQGLGIRDAAATFMEPWGVPSGGDWALHRGGSVFVEGTVNTVVRGNLFKRVDGNALFISGYNRGALFDSNEFNWIGDSAMASWGYTDEHDGTGGEQPRGTVVSNNVCHELGVFQLQSSCWFQAKTAQTTVIKNLFYNGPRAGINMNDGFGGANRITQNVIWNQCRQSGDHGPINSWDRQLFWTDVRDGAAKPGWNPAYTEVDRNVIIANYGGSQGFDNDDGSSWYNIHHNVIYGEGLKQDYGGHDSRYHHNLNLVHQYDGQNCINTWPFKLGQGPCGDWSEGAATCSHHHRFEDNKCLVLYTDIYSPGAGGCPPSFDTMALLANNSYYTPTAGNATMSGCGTLATIQKRGSELGSISLGLPTDAEWLAMAASTLQPVPAVVPPSPPTPPAPPTCVASGKCLPFGDKKKDAKTLCCSHKGDDDKKVCGKKGVVCK